MDFITQLLAQLIDKFKAKNPNIFILIQLCLVVLQQALIEIDAADVIPNDEIITKILSYIGYVLMILVGSRTYTFVNKDNKAG